MNAEKQLLEKIGQLEQTVSALKEQHEEFIFLKESEKQQAARKAWMPRWTRPSLPKSAVSPRTLSGNSLNQWEWLCSET